MGTHTISLSVVKIIDGMRGNGVRPHFRHPSPDAYEMVCVPISPFPHSLLHPQPLSIVLVAIRKTAELDLLFRREAQRVADLLRLIDDDLVAL